MNPVERLAAIEANIQNGYRPALGVWRLVEEIPGFEDKKGYRVWDTGVVESLYTGRGRYARLGDSWNRLEGRNSQRYRQVVLVGDRGHKSVLVGRLVLLAFVGPPPPGNQVLHGRLEKTEDGVDNVKWGTASANIREECDKGRCGLGRGVSYWGDEVVSLVKRLRHSGISWGKIHDITGVPVTTCHAWVSGRNRRGARSVEGGVDGLARDCPAAAGCLATGPA